MHSECFLPFSLVVSSSSLAVMKTKSQQKEGNILGASITLIATTLAGAIGMFGNVYAVSQLGFIGYTFFMIMSCAFLYASIQFLSLSSEISQNYSFQDLSHSYLGGYKGSVFTRIFIVFGNWTVLIVIIQIFADFMPHALSALFNINPASFIVSRWFSVLLGLTLIFPWIIVKDITKLTKLSIVCFIFSLFPFTILLLNGIKAIANDSISPSFEIITFNARDIFIGLPTLSWIWCCQYNVLPLYSSLNRLTRTKQIHSVSLITCVVLFCCYYINGLSAYFVWGQDINQDFITNLDFNNRNYVFYFPKWMSIVTQLLMCIASFISQPLYTIEARVNLHSIVMDMCGLSGGVKVKRGITGIPLSQSDMSDRDSHAGWEEEDEKTSMMYDIDVARSSAYVETTASRIIEGTLIVLSAATVAIFVTNVNGLIALSGATYACYISYFLPSFTYYRAISMMNGKPTKYQLTLKYIAILMIIYSVIICVLGIISLLV
eukprot:1026716_1